jgi:hypothetical protein
MKLEKVSAAALSGCPGVRRHLALAALATTLGLGSATAMAGVTSTGALTGGARWDAAYREKIGQNGFGERSLVGGLRYNMQGGSYEAFRNLFTWNTVPTVSAFQSTVEQAFRAWEAVDPVSGYGTSLRFVWDPATAVKGASTGHHFREGAEIDLFGATSTFNWNVGNGTTQAESSVATFTTFDMSNLRVKLTSGTTNYAGSLAIAGADIVMNSNSQAVWTLDIFRRLLTHEIGNAIGLVDVDVGTVQFIDDNYNPANAAATLTNNWAHLVNPLNPANSAGLTIVTNPNVGAPGVDILMEHFNLGIGPTNPVTKLVPLSNDDFSMRQFLYPELVPVPVPEPHEYMLFAAGIGLVLSRVRARRAKSSAA